MQSSMSTALHSVPFSFASAWLVCAETKQNISTWFTFTKYCWKFSWASSSSVSLKHNSSIQFKTIRFFSIQPKNIYASREIIATKIGKRRARIGFERNYIFRHFGKCHLHGGGVRLHSIHLAILSAQNTLWAVYTRSIRKKSMFFCIATQRNRVLLRTQTYYSSSDKESANVATLAHTHTNMATCIIIICAVEISQHEKNISRMKRKKTQANRMWRSPAPGRMNKTSFHASWYYTCASVRSFHFIFFFLLILFVFSHIHSLLLLDGLVGNDLW